MNSNSGMPDKYEILYRYFGYKSFREAQEQIIDNILSGRDCLGVMPTGAGKSICFQVPALMLQGVTIVISPLISLMKDQAQALNENGINAACINSSMAEWECENVFRAAYDGRIKILYVAPERLETPRFISLVKSLRIPLVAVDEAHCVSQWGQDFRPSYLRISAFIKELPERPIVAAFTATATDNVRRDIISFLGLDKPFEVTTGFDRPNLFFDVRKPDDKDAELLKILSEPLNGSAIVYCATRKKVDYVCGMLCFHGIRAGAYHAGMPTEDRAAVQESFIFDRIDVIVATNAFGMGIDKSNVRLVVHYNCPMYIESYYQEAGRAGRDGGESRCIMFYSKSDKELAEYMIKVSHSDGDFTEEERDRLISNDYNRLAKMVKYGNLSTCLRSYILSYFGEKDVPDCGWCSNCVKGYNVTDITVDSQKLLSCVFRLKQRGKALPFAEICSIVLGECSEEYSTLSTYGVMRGEDKKRLEKIGEYLLREKFFEESEPEKLCVLTPKTDEYMRLRKTIRMKSPKSTAEFIRNSEIPNPELFNTLRELRKKQAAVLGVPPYVVFTDESLKDMCTLLPTNEEDFYKVKGVGTKKAARYGKKFTAVIKQYVELHKKPV